MGMGPQLMVTPMVGDKDSTLPSFSSLPGTLEYWRPQLERWIDRSNAWSRDVCFFSQIWRHVCLHFFGLFSQKASFFWETLFGEKHEIFTLLEEAVNDFPFGSRDIWTGDDFEPEILKAYRNLADWPWMLPDQDASRSQIQKCHFANELPWIVLKIT